MGVCALGIGMVAMISAGCGRVDFDVLDDAPPVTNDDASTDGIMFGFAFGDQTVETQGPDTHGCGSAEASSFYTLRSGVVNALVIWHATNAGDNVTSVIVGLYDNLGDSPNNLLAQGTITPGGVLAGDTWYTATIPDVAFTTDTIYWIAMTCPVGAGNGVSMQYKYIGATGAGPCQPSATVPCTQHSAQSNLTAFPATWTAGLKILPSMNSFYAAYN